MKENEQGLNAPAVPQSARSAAVAGASERVGPPASDDPRFTTPGSLEVTPSPTSTEGNFQNILNMDYVFPKGLKMTPFVDV